MVISVSQGDRMTAAVKIFNKSCFIATFSKTKMEEEFATKNNFLNFESDFDKAHCFTMMRSFQKSNSFTTLLLRRSQQYKSIFTPLLFLCSFNEIGS